MNLKNLENYGAFFDSRPVYPAHDFSSEVKSLIGDVKIDDLCIKLESNGIRLFSEGEDEDNMIYFVTHDYMHRGIT